MGIQAIDPIFQPIQQALVKKRYTLSQLYEDDSGDTIVGYIFHRIRWPYISTPGHHPMVKKKTNITVDESIHFDWNYPESFRSGHHR